jgi:hypothetical protein
MKYVQPIIDSIIKNKKLIGIVLLIVIALLSYNSCNENHKKEIKALEKEIAVVQNQFEEAVAEKERFKDSSEIYEAEAEQAGVQVVIFKSKAEKLRKEKEAALAALHNLPKEVIDSFFVKRYDTVSKVGVDLALDQNVGNAVIIELTEKDYLVGELTTTKQENGALTSQVGSLQNSLMFSKVALMQADSAIALKSKQFEISQQVSEMLKKDLKGANKKAFWNKWKGAGVGIAAGLAIGLLAK